MMTVFSTTITKELLIHFAGSLPQPSLPSLRCAQNVSILPIIMLDTVVRLYATILHLISHHDGCARCLTCLFRIGTCALLVTSQFISPVACTWTGMESRLTSDGFGQNYQGVLFVPNISGKTTLTTYRLEIGAHHILGRDRLSWSILFQCLAFYVIEPLCQSKYCQLTS